MTALVYVEQIEGELMDENEIAKMLESQIEEAMVPVACQLWLAIYEKGLSQEFCVSFDALWPILGYSTQGNAKRGLQRSFSINDDYIVRTGVNAGNVSDDSDKQKPKNLLGGRNKETILLTVRTAQKFAMITRTPEADAFGDLIIAVMHSILQWQKSRVVHVASLTPAENQQLRIGRSELTIQGLIAKAYAFMGMPFEAEVQCGQRIADFVYRRFGAPVIVEVKKVKMTVAEAEAEHAKFLQKKQALPSRWQVKNKPAEFLLLAPAFEPETIIAMRGRATCRTFGELREQMQAKIIDKWASVNANKLKQQQKQFDLIFNSIAGLT